MTAAEVLVARGTAAIRVQRHARGWLARRRCRAPLKHTARHSNALCWAAALDRISHKARSPGRQSSNV